MDWFRSYLFDRKQSVKMNLLTTITGSPNWEIMKKGVPQGLLLEPLLNTYMNDFSELMNSHSDVIMFVDDIRILISNTNHDELNLNFKLVLIQISKWLQANQLILNIEKTSLVKFSPTKSSYPLNLSYAGKIFIELSNINFLGLQLDSQPT